MFYVFHNFQINILTTETINSVKTITITRREIEMMRQKKHARNKTQQREDVKGKEMR